MADDVRVRLSAEGVQEVVGALRKVKEEAKETSSAGAQYFAQWRKEIEKIGPAIAGAFAAGAIISKVKSLFDEVSNTALAMGKLAQATGLSTDALQVYTKAAGKSEEAQNAMQKSLSVFTRTVGQAELGTKKAVQGFSDLGIKVSEFAKLNMDQKLQTVADKLIGIKDPAQRAAVGFEFFGKSFQQMYPILLKVHNEGFGPMLDRLKELGIYLDSDTIASMRGVKKAMNEMGEEAKGMATQFLAGLLPGVQATMDGILKSTNGAGVNGFKKLGEWVGWLVNVVQKGMALIGAAIGETLGAVSVAADKQIEILKSKASLWEKTKAAFKLGTPALWASTISSDQKMDGTRGAAKDFWAAVTEGPQARPKKQDADDRDTIVGQRNQKALDAARLALFEAQLQAEQRIAEAYIAKRESQDKAAYDAGEISLEEYYKRRLALIRAKNALELDFLQQRRDAIAKQPIDRNDDGSQALRKEQQLAQLDGEIIAKEIEGKRQLITLTAEQATAERQLNNERLAAEAKLLALEGKKAEAARITLDLELQKLRLELAKSGAGTAEIDEAIARERAAGEAKISYDAAKRDADTTLSALNTHIKAIQDQVKAGVLFPAQAEQQIMELERERLPILEQTAQKLAEIAKQTNDPALIEAAEQYKLKVQEIKIATDEVGQQMARLKETAEQSAESGIGKFLTDVETHTKNIGQAFRGMVASFAESILKMENDWLAKKFVQWLMGDGTQNNPGGMGSIKNLFSQGASGAAGAAGSAETTTITVANTTAVSANTASITALTAALAANTASQQAGAASGGSGGGGLMGMFSGMFAGGEGAAGGAEAGGVADAAMMAADGGHVRGPGTSTSDSIHAKLSDGEFVVKAQAVQRPGMLALLHAINNGSGGSHSAGVQRYAEGGIVSGGGGGNSLKIINVPDASLLEQHLNGPVGEQQVLNIISKNPQRVRQTLG